MSRGRKKNDPKIKDADTPPRDESAQSTEPKRLYPAAPEWVSDKKARAEWDRLIPDLIRRKKYLHLFEAELGRYCVYAGVFFEAAKQLTPRKGSPLAPVTMSSKNVPMLSQHMVVMNQAHERMRQLASDLGLNAVDYLKLENAQFDLFDTATENANQQEGEAQDNVTPFSQFRRQT